MAFDVEAPVLQPGLPAVSGRFEGVRRAIRRNPLGAVAGLACVLLVLLAVFGPSIAPHSANDTSFERLAAPSAAHPFGTDNLFRDIFSRIVVGARNSLGVGFAAVFVSTLVGVVLGVGSGYLGGYSDLAVSRIMDVMLAYPGLVFLIFVVTIFGPSFLSISVAIGLYMTPTATRVIRSAAIGIRSQPFIEAALSIGCSPLRIMARHVLPNVAPAIIVVATIQIGAAILAEAALSFLGLGVSSAQSPSWGRMLQETKPVWQAAWWTAVAPGLAITFTVLVYNLFGDALRDALAVFGLAALCAYIARYQEKPSRWQVDDEGPYYRITLDAEIDLHSLPEEPPRLAMAVRSGSRPDDELRGIPDVFDLNAEWERVRAFAEQRAQRRSSGEELAEMQPASFFAVADFIAWRLLQFRSSYHDLLRRWHDLSGAAFSSTAALILEACSTPPGALSGLGPAWMVAMRQSGRRDARADATRLQALNPSQGKGLNRPKPSSVAVGNESGFWVLEYLKAAGLGVAGAPRRVRASGGQQVDARKLYVVAPGSVRSDVLDLVMARFTRALRDDQPVKLDILAALRFAEAILETQKEARPRGEPWAFDPAPTLVLGLHSVTFQSLGQAAAVMNIGFLDTPAWLAVPADADIDAYLALVREHVGVIGTIDEQGEGFELLRTYREFVATGRLESFIEFCGRYGEFFLRNLAQNRRFLRRFTVGNLEVMMQSQPNLSEIVRNSGFRALATAIRLSTVSPQYRQRMADGGSLYDVRYGLGQDLVRHSVDKQKFAAKLSEFVQSYNAENARVYERRNEQRRRNIEVSELDEVFRLVDAYGAGLVGRLLVAYGYARDPREPDVPQQDSAEAQPASA